MNKVAFTGTSGSGKTTLVKFVSEYCFLKHISGSAGDLAKPGDSLYKEMFGFPGGGHAGVIRFSALNPEYGILNQKMVQQRRAQIIKDNDNFVTDRSPVDNFTYFVNQVGFHPMVTDRVCNDFMNDCLEAWRGLTHVIYIKAVQPYDNGVETNQSRVDNWFYQKAIDAQFERWLLYFMEKAAGPLVKVIDYWDLKKRKDEVVKFITYGQ